MKKFQVLAPTRADLAGGTLDLWPIYCLVGGSRTINVALDLHQKITITLDPGPKADLTIRSGGETFHSPAYESPLEKLRTAAHPATVFPAFVVSRFHGTLRTLPSGKLSIVIETDVPRGSGLGGSSALCVAMAKGLGALVGELVGTGWEWDALAWVKDLEAEFLGVPTGTQDYLAALFGGARSYRFSLGRPVVEDYDAAVSEGLERRLLVLFSGETHQSGLSNWEVFKRVFDGDERVREGIRALKRNADELHAVLGGGAPDWREVGRLMNDEWDTRRKTFGVHTPRLDELVALVRDAGALGVKVCGAAQGGCLVALVEEAKRKELLGSCAARNVAVLPAKPSARGVRVVAMST